MNLLNMVSQLIVYGDSMEIYVQTTSLVNYNKGVFSLYFVSQNQQQMANGKGHSG